MQQPQLRRGANTVCLFGLSADPPTGNQGHIGIVKALQEERAWESIWVIPVYRHTYQEKQDRLVSFEHRFRMCQLAFEPLNQVHHQESTNDDDEAKSPLTKIIVSDVERSSWQYAAKKLSSEEDAATLSVGTASLLEYLKVEYPDTEFSFCLGADSYKDLIQGKWKESKRVIDSFGDRLVVFARGDAPVTANPRHTVVTVDSLSTVSSTQVRNCSDVDQLRAMLSPKVLAYMQEHGLYKFDKHSITRTSDGGVLMGVAVKLEGGHMVRS